MQNFQYVRKAHGLSQFSYCFCNTSEINGVKSPLYSSCFQKELRKKLLYYLLILYKICRQNLTAFCRQKFNPSEKSIVHFVAASHTPLPRPSLTCSQSVIFSCGFSSFFMMKSFFKWGPPRSIGCAPTLLQLPISSFFALLNMPHTSVS